MKTMAIRLDDEVAEFLGMVATLEGTSQIDQIREAIMAHLSRKMSDGELSERAKAALDDIDREASARKQAISTLLGGNADQGQSPPKSGSRRRQSSKPTEGKVIQLGFAPPPKRGGK